MINVNRTKESIQNVLIFVTDAIAILVAYYLAGLFWVGLHRGQGVKAALYILNNNFITIINQL